MVPALLIYIPMNSQSHTHTTISVCSLNVNRSNAATHAAMHTIGEKTTPAPDLLLIQDPWWEKLNNEHATISFPGWQAILPKSHITENECPHITAYHRQSAHLEVMLRTDILSDLDTMILEVKRTGDPNKPTRIINIYNQRQLGENRNIYTVDHLARIHLNSNTPMIITGDWNTRHPDWDDGVNLLTPRVRETLEWVEGNGFILWNEPFVPTQEDNAGHATVINLTFKNAMADLSNILSGHHVDTVIGALSDHHALVFKIANLEMLVYNATSYNLNWKHAEEDTFREQLENQLEKEKDTYKLLVSEVLNSEKETAMPEELDRAANTIQNTLTQAVLKAMPERKICDKSKPWWTLELTTVYKELHDTREVL